MRVASTAGRAPLSVNGSRRSRAGDKVVEKQPSSRNAASSFHNESHDFKRLHKLLRGYFVLEVIDQILLETATA
jgi:hypothetical protein